ncbi:GGDEF domain-containing protein [Pseudomonas poae]|uniref:Diguanylate cyclase (GGDEF) domain-containing protein n=1 Tax=Pseudomonas poae TaxID=200451 RepID=A0ABY0RCR3_9PSED|nr:GGDEF domain-containing protein [Pseudomonas poae]SDN66293.1 diguanylate cyclase (GGDEF) domain-containing protein [Pseudomonas poae]
MANLHSFPSTPFIRWFVKDNESLDQEIRLKLLKDPFTSRAALIAAGMNTLLVCSVAAILHPTLFFISWLVVDMVIWIIRWFVLQRFTASGTSRLPYAMDLSLLFGLIWAAEIGIGTAGCIISQDPVLQVLACTSAVSMNGAIAMRNQGIPRYAFSQILLTDIPMKLATLFQPEPLLRVLILQAPMYLTGLWVLLNHLNANLTSAYIAEVQSTHSATHDNLTGVLNRLGMLNMLTASLSTKTIKHSVFSVLYLDLDGFKKINDAYGHATGDGVLVSFCAMIAGIIRKSDAIARIGGDEFIVLMPDTDNVTASRIAERIIKAFADYTEGNAHYQGLGVSIGITQSTRSRPESVDQVLSRADIAMYEAKSAGKNCYRFG